jgi:hypothetical protein
MAEVGQKKGHLTVSWRNQDVPLTGLRGTLARTDSSVQ